MMFLPLAAWAASLAALVGGGLVAHGRRERAASAAGAVAPPAAYAPPPRPVLLTDPTLTLMHGRPYLATVFVSAPLSWLATASAVAEHARRQGFTHVVVHTDRPAWWPGAASGDYYVTGNYAERTRLMYREHGGGRVVIREAFEGLPG